MEVRLFILPANLRVLRPDEYLNTDITDGIRSSVPRRNKKKTKENSYQPQEDVAEETSKYFHNITGINQ